MPFQCVCLCVKTIIEPLKFKGYLVSLKIDSSFKIYDIDWELPIKNISQHQYYAFSLKILAKIQFLVCSGIGLLKHLKKDWKQWRIIEEQRASDGQQFQRSYYW